MTKKLNFHNVKETHHRYRCEWHVFSCICFDNLLS